MQEVASEPGPEEGEQRAALQGQETEAQSCL